MSASAEAPASPRTDRHRLPQFKIRPEPAIVEAFRALADARGTTNRLLFEEAALDLLLKERARLPRGLQQQILRLKAQRHE